MQTLVVVLGDSHPPDCPLDRLWGLALTKGLTSTHTNLPSSLYLFRISNAVSTLPMV